jgi:GTP-binding protein
MAPVIAIVGRPNVGKSTLFNRMLGKRKSLVHDRPGVTRDRIFGTATWLEREFHLIDTGGFEPDLSLLEEGDMFRSVRRQAEAAVEGADLVLFVVDREAGVTPADRLTADILRKSLGDREDRLVLVVNKCDGPRHDDDAFEFYEMGFHPLICVSAAHGRGVYEMWEAITERLPPGPEADESEDDDGEIRIAVIGRPNIGKSTLVNRLLGEERHVVHDMPGTTMDAVDSVIEKDGQVWRIVDTAGIRRKARIGDKVETWATLQAIKTIERCHVTLLMIDAAEGVSAQDARLAALVVDRGRACVLLLNRWDEVRLDPERNVSVVDDELDQSLPHLSWAPRLYISALTGKGCHRILPEVTKIFAQFDKRIPTARLNEWLKLTVEAHTPPQKHNHPVRLNYATQARVRPPTFLVWSNSPEAIKPPYKRYLENRLRETWDFEGTPLRIHFKKKRKPGQSKDEL